MNQGTPPRQPQIAQDNAAVSSGTAVSEVGRLRARGSIRLGLYLAFSGVAALSVLATAVAWISFTNVERTVETIAEEHLPAMADAQQIATRSAELSVAAPRLAAAGDMQWRADVMSDLTERSTVLQAAIERLRGGAAERMEAEHPARLDEIARPSPIFETTLDGWMTR